MNNSKYRVAIVDDHEDARTLISNILIREGYDTKTFSRAEEMIESFSKNNDQNHNAFDLVISDVNMPNFDGLALTKKIKEQHPETPVILISGSNLKSVEDEAKIRGAFDYLLKPLQSKSFISKVQDALKINKYSLPVDKVKGPNKDSTFDMIGNSPAISSVLSLIRKVAPTKSTVLVTGESGTGKELVARAIHTVSERSQQPFIAINCSAIPESLLESELFGHAKGSFTGAVQRKRGLFEEAEGGTLFLDEIGDMNLILQAKLLRAIQEKKIRAVGDNIDKQIDVRIIAATHRNLKQAVKQNLFREDLFYRLNVLPIKLPALRDRKEDIPLLVQHFIKKHRANNKIYIEGVTEQAMKKLISMSWDGNIRELENVIERSVLLASGRILNESDISILDSDVLTPTPSDIFESAKNDSVNLSELERRYIIWALEKTNNHKDKASQLLGICRRTLYRKEREYGLITDNDNFEATTDGITNHQ